MPPPPLVAELPEIVELVTVRTPALLNAPPLLLNFAPETVTPEMLRLPPEAMLKILKLRVELMVPEESSKPLMVSEEEPGPVMARVPLGAPLIKAVASKMVGSEALTVLLRESSVIVPVTLKLMMSSPAVALAKLIASLSEIKVSPELTISKVVSTVMGTGLIRCSRLRSSGLAEPETLRAFRFWEL